MSLKVEELKTVPIDRFYILKTLIEEILYCSVFCSPNLFGQNSDKQSTGINKNISVYWTKIFFCTLKIKID